MDVYKKMLRSKLDMADYKIFKNEPPEEFLYYFDAYNVYPLFPTIIDFTLPPCHDFSVDKIGKGASNLENSDNVNNLINLLNKKLKSDDITEDEIRNKTKGMIRKFFSHEIIDHININYNGEYVTTAWAKCYEIISYYDLIKYGDEINYYGICEQPGAFVYAINHYIKTNKISKKFNFKITSLVNKMNDKVFKAEQSLMNEHGDTYDYGVTGNGDVTDEDNLIYFRKKNYNIFYHLISADCGEDCSDDFTLQEKNLLPLIIGQLTMAIGLASKGTNYFFKLFTLHEDTTKQIMAFLTNIFEKVVIARVLQTKPESGEVYCICKNFKYEKSETDIIFDKLISTKKNIYPCDKNILDVVDDCNEIINMRRIISMNFIKFRFKNNDYVQKNKLIMTRVDNLVNHYKYYFCDIYQIKKLNDEDKLVSKRFKNKWIKGGDYEAMLLHYKNTIIKPEIAIFSNDVYMDTIIGTFTYVKHSYLDLPLSIERWEKDDFYSKKEIYEVMEAKHDNYKAKFRLDTSYAFIKKYFDVYKGVDKYLYYDSIIKLINPSKGTSIWYYFNIWDDNMKSQMKNAFYFKEGDELDFSKKGVYFLSFFNNYKKSRNEISNEVSFFVKCASRMPLGSTIAITLYLFTDFDFYAGVINLMSKSFDNVYVVDNPFSLTQRLFHVVFSGKKSDVVVPFDGMTKKFYDHEFTHVKAFVEKKLSKIFDLYKMLSAINKLNDGYLRMLQERKEIINSFYIDVYGEQKNPPHTM